MSRSQPLVSVVLPVHNGEKYVAEAVRSILDQSLSDLELIVVNDGSDDGTREVLEELRSRCNDRRLRICHLCRVGFVKALNLGIQQASGKYIARMDADDVALPHRLRVQASFLDNHPDYLVCGSFIEVFDSTGYRSSMGFPSSDEEIRAVLFANCCICHPAAMLRRQVFFEHHLWYREEYGTVADYDLWTRVVDVGKVANLPLVLLRYRRHSQQVSVTDTPQVATWTNRVWRYQLEKLLPPTEEEFRLHASLARRAFPNHAAKVAEAARWLEKLWKTNMQKQKYPVKPFTAVLQAWWYDLCRSAARRRQIPWRTYFLVPPPLRRMRYASSLLYHACYAREVES